MTARTEEKKGIANRFPEEVATRGNLDLIDEICAEYVVEYSPLGEVRGREELKEASKYIRAAFADLSVTVEDAVAEGDTVVQRLTFRGIHEGEFMGIEPTGRAVEASNVVFSTIEGGEITERWLQPDVLSVMQQLGVVEPPTGDVARPSNAQPSGPTIMTLKHDSAGEEVTIVRRWEGGLTWMAHPDEEMRRASYVLVAGDEVWLVGHGEPVFENARARLDEALAASGRGTASAIARAVPTFARLAYNEVRG